MPTIRPFRSKTARVATASERTLPSYTAGQVEMPLRIIGSQEAMEHETYWSEHSHPTHELLWREAGVGTVTIDQRTWTITPPLGMWIPAGVRHSGWTPAGVVVYAAQFSLDNPLVSDRPTAIAITPLLRLLLDRLQHTDPGTSSYSLTEAMILDVMTPADNELLLHMPSNPLIAPIANAIIEGPADASSLQDWARKLGISGRTITRAFEAETGLGFGRWATTARVQHAVSMISLGGEVDEAAAGVGYRSVSAFTTAFKRITGTTPGQFRPSAN
ncbi:MAG: helix-turn-helix domain-containing protein [Brevibacterium aurantiacum]|uniref:AraC family transcriptional regulator n=3 Tax=Brevibacterium TaxID=1696 RepID=A0A2A3ZG50_BREAU|nr:MULTISPECIES: AraC family transcriptional regulator [Brevibacterium]MDN5550188.1 AraC family transcriptional regulator [Brevibacterium sp.]MDN5593220.1 AraC family transcriptional regulator [Brevibacterium sp.]MDN5607694.1 AraC family transcriptional regulator [Brevibacterium sp.]MDN5712502.1 AraC family transcriptional regulator [Brevibacterium aurantiacum]MDN5736204.1 AraC family transcriptional regulator [Brevibacterium aurantiacum]